MPELPSLGNLPQAQFDKIVGAFPGVTVADKIQAFKDWYTNRLIDRVQESESIKVNQAIISQLPPRRPEPPFPTS